MAELLRESPQKGVTILTLNRPERLNAITPQLVRELHSVLDEIAVDTSCRVVMLTGAGRGFCSCADIRGGSAEQSAREGQTSTPGGPVWAFALQELYSGLILKFRSLPQPIIAAVNGPAAGGGLAMVLGCDIRLAAESARFAASFVRIGLSGCDMGTSWLLSRVVGAGAAHELMLTGRIIDATEAYRIGLVLDVVPDGKVVERALEKANLIMANSPFGVSMTKQVMWSTLEIPNLSAAVDLENRTQVLMSTTSDYRESMAAFLEKRDPDFKHA